VAVLALLLFRGGDSGPRQLDKEHATEAVQTLGQKLSLAIQNERDTRPLLDPAAKLVEQYPEFAPAYTLHGQVLMTLGRLDAAAKQMRTALEIGGEDPQTRALLGGVYLKLEDDDAARSNYQAAISLEKENPEHRVKLANLEYEAGNLEAAKRAALDALALDSSRHQAYALLSQVYEKQGEPSLAAQQMEKALEVLGGEEEATRVAYVRRRAAMLRRINRPEDALAALRELPPEMLFNMDIAPDFERTYGMMGQPLLVAAYYEEISRIEPVNPEPVASAAAWYLKAGDEDSARAMVQRLRKLNPRHPQLPALVEKLKP
jgi:tetratricopeptide (TPR) repeat protein